MFPILDGDRIESALGAMSAVNGLLRQWRMKPRWGVIGVHVETRKRWRGESLIRSDCIGGNASLSLSNLFRSDVGRRTVRLGSATATALGKKQSFSKPVIG